MAVLCAILFPLVSCSKDTPGGCIVFAGPTTEREVSVSGGFHTLELYDYIHLEVHPGQENRLVLHGGRHLLDQVDIQLQDSVISIRNRNACNWMLTMRQVPTLQLHTKSLRNIQYSGSGNVSFADTLVRKTFTLEVRDGYGMLSPILDVRECSFKLHSGAATLKPEGIADKADIWAASLGLFDGRNLVTKQVFIQHRSGNHAYVWAEDSLHIRLQSSGNLYFRGNPTIHFMEHTGTGGAYPFP